MSLVIAVDGKYKDYHLPDFKNVKKVPHPHEIDGDFEHIIHEHGEGLKGHQKFQRKSAKHSYQKVEKGIPSKRHVIFAHQIMTKSVHGLQFSQTISEARSVMQSHSFHHIPVLEGERMVGIISDRDLLLSRSNKDDSIKVGSICSREVIAAKQETEIRIIAGIMVDQTISCVPIINDDYELVGIITKTDILQCVMKNMPLEIWV